MRGLEAQVATDGRMQGAGKLAAIASRGRFRKPELDPRNDLLRAEQLPNRPNQRLVAHVADRPRTLPAGIEIAVHRYPTRGQPATSALETKRLGAKAFSTTTSSQEI